jgi:hypothetical protein
VPELGHPEGETRNSFNGRAPLCYSARYEKFELVFAHIAGIPVEKTLPSFGLMIAATGGVAGPSRFRRARGSAGRQPCRRKRRVR